MNHVMASTVQAKPPVVCSCLAICLCLVAGCDLPRDPAGTTQRVRGGVIHVGVMHHFPWIDVSEQGTRVTGIEATLVQRMADEFDARVEWHPAGESQLMESLKNFELDLVVGGLSDKSIWSKRVGLTKPYVKAPFNPCAASPAAGAKPVGHVFAVPPGENAWLLTVQDFLRRNRPEAERLLDRACRGDPPSNSPEPSDATH